MILSKEEVEHLLGELKRANDIANGVIDVLRKVQSNKLNKAATEEDLQEYRTIKQVVESLKSVA